LFRNPKKSLDIRDSGEWVIGSGIEEFAIHGKVEQLQRVY
jgi:hypothetical protein